MTTHNGSYVAPHSCEWTEDDDGVWDTACGERWEFSTPEPPSGHGVKFCHACGGNVVEAAYSFRDSEADDDDYDDDTQDLMDRDMGDS